MTYHFDDFARDLDAVLNDEWWRCCCEGDPLDLEPHRLSAGLRQDLQAIFDRVRAGG